MNFVDGRLREENGQLFFSVGGIAIGLPRDKAARAKGAESLTLGIRPEDLLVNSSGSASETARPTSPAFDGRVVLVERLGATSHVHFDVEGGSRMMASVANDQLPEAGETISVRVSLERVHLFGLDGTTLSHSI
jgi:ABC-type sugar transport system ATPase subunit